MTKTVEISQDLFLEIIRQIEDRLDSSLPCSISVPPKDRAIVLEQLGERYRNHVEQHWELDKPATFMDCDDVGVIPVL